MSIKILSIKKRQEIKISCLFDTVGLSAYSATDTSTGVPSQIPCFVQ